MKMLEHCPYSSRLPRLRRRKAATSKSRLMRLGIAPADASAVRNRKRTPLDVDVEGVGGERQRGVSQRFRERSLYPERRLYPSRSVETLEGVTRGFGFLGPGLFFKEAASKAFRSRVCRMGSSVAPSSPPNQAWYPLHARLFLASGRRSMHDPSPPLAIRIKRNPSPISRRTW